jgi:hypothetical protein
MKWQIVEGDKVVIEQDTKPLYCAPGQRIREAPSPWPPRVWLEKYEPIKVGLPVAYQYWPALDRQTKYTDGVEYLSVSEHTHLLAEAVREAKAQAFEEAANMAKSLSVTLVDDGVVRDLRKKASELRKGATPENGGKP